MREDSDFVLWRAEGVPPTGVPLLTLALVAEHPTPAMRAQLLNELALRDRLDGAWAARPLAIGGSHGREELSLEDPGGELLSGLTGEPWPLAEFLRVALSITRALAGAHERGLLHRDVKPGNIFWDMTAGSAHLTGFGFASLVSRGQAVTADAVVAGTVAYMSPEQTGRVNLAVDERSDLYALGVTLYELLTGSVPFRTQDPLELIYSHVARLPTPPGNLVESIPGVVSAIVVKLLAKAPEERYQSARGLEHDLRRCLKELEESARIDEFALGQNDASGPATIP